MNELQQHPEGFRLSRQQADAVASERRLGHPLRLRGTRRFEGRVELPRLGAALERVCVRHEILRTVFRDVAGLEHPLQVIEPTPTYRLGETELAGAREAVLSVSVRHSDRGSEVCVLAPASHLDEGSMEALLAELEDTYAGRERAGDPLQYVDYSEWQHELVQSSWGRQAQSFWASQLRPDAVAAPLPFETPLLLEQGAAAEPAIGVLELPFERLRPALERLASALDLTARDALFCIWAAFATRAFGRTHVTIAVVVDKQEAELAGTLGRFARRIPVSCAFDPAASLRQGFTTAQARLGECLAWREAFVESASWGRAARQASHALGFSHRQRATPAGEPQRTHVEFDPADLERLRLELVAQADGAALRLLYREDSLERATVEVWAEQLASFAGAVGDLEQPLRRVSLLGEAERRRLLETFVGRPPRAQGEPVFLHQLFEAAARQYPERPAIVHRDVELSYAALERRAQQLAHHLLAQGVGPEEVVAVYAGRSCELIVALLGILQAGAAYLPLDPSYPAERLRMMVEDARVRRVLVFAPGDAAPELGAAEAISLAEGSPVWHAPEGALPAEGSTGRLAYMIYTSGSTGKPKGVMVSHANALASTRARFGFYDWHIDCFLLLSSVSFDSSVAGIFWTLGCGGCLCLPEDGQHKDASLIAELIRRRDVTHLLTLPSFYEQLLGELGSSRVRGVIVAGEACPSALARRHFDALPEVSLVNEYGPTEGTVWSTAWRLRAGDTGPVPIGGPIETMRTYVLDAALELAPIGATGELFISGHGITRGYFGRPSLTAERYLPDPYGQAGERMYRTGDSVRFRPDAALEFFGRVDQQVKLRGYRIELGEIEARILEHAEIAEAAVAVRELLPGQGRLVAYVVPAARAAASDAEAWHGLEQRLREHLSSRLPEFMQPAHWLALEVFPQTPNGKIDRAALPAPGREERSEHVAPRNELEQRLADIWKQVLHVERVGVQDNFFQLGGDSIVLLQVVALARQRGLQLTARDVFGQPTVAELARFIAAGRLAGPADEPLDTELPLSPAQRWFFGEHGAAPDAQSQWRSFEPSERLDPARLERCLRQLCELHDALRLSFARGADGGWRQAHVPALVLHERWAAAPLLERISLSDAGELPARIEAARARLRLDQGRLLGALLVELGGAERLVLIVHRLVVDPVSWQLLAADLGALYRDGERDRAGLLCRTSSLASFGAALLRRAVDPGLAAELEHWQSQLFDARAEHFPRDHELAEYSAELARWSVELDAELLAILLERVCPSHRVGLEALLLAALARVICRYGRKSSVVIAVERQRAPRPFDGIELSRSVGWLSSHFPVRVRPELHGVSSGLSSVARIKQQLAGVPGNGGGYGLAKYLAERDLAGPVADAAWPRAAFSFHAHDTLPDALLRPSALDGPLSAGAPGAWLSLEAARVDGRLTLSWAYQRALYREETVTALGRALCAELEALAARAALEPPAAVEPSDFPLARLGPAELEGLALDWAEIDDLFPLSPMQQGMLLHTLLEPGSGIYLMQDHYQIDSAIDAAKLAEAWREVARRHPALRAQFVLQQDGNMLQAIRRELPVPLEQLDYRGLDAAEQRQRLAEALRGERERGFDTSRAPLWALRLVRLGEERYELVISHHHIIMDGWSWGLVWLDVCAIYQDALDGKPQRRPEAPSYREFIAWIAEQDPEAAARYWRGALAGFEEATPLAFDRAPTPEAHGSSIDAVRSTWSEAETRALNELSARHGLTTNTFLQAAWALALSRHSGRREVLFGVTVAGRPTELPELQRAVGLFINTIPLRLSLPGGRVHVSEFLQALLEQNVEMRQHEHLPLVRVQALSGVPKSEPLFHSLLVYENVPLDSSLLPHAQNLRVRAGASRVHTNYPLTVMVLPGRELALDLSFDERFFERGTVARLLAELERLLRALIAGFERPLWELTGASEAERRELLGYGRGPERRVPVERGYAALLLERARSTPERLVARGGGGSLTYAELESRSAYVAAGLQARGVPLEGRVGVLVERGVELLGFAIGVLRAGAIYVPLDPSHPPERLARALTRARLQVVLCSPASAQKLAAAVEALGGATEVELWAPPATPTGEPLPFGAARYAGPRSVAYVIHTSGSTGEPKGAMVEHAGMLNNVLGKVSDLGLTEADVIAQTASAAFDISVWQLLTGPLCGARVEIVPDAIAQDPEALLRHVQATGITVLESVPSLIEALLSEPAEPLPSLRWMITTGEAMSPDLARRWRERYPEVGLLNAYGPAECADDVALCRIEASSEGRLYLPIGRATDNNRLYVLDAALGLVPFGATGELCIAGVGPGRGYLDAPGHTARAFVPNPYAEEPGERLYRTGDRARFEPDGSLAFVGRADDQVKIRGYRLELGEIEARLREHAAVQEGVVVVKGGAQGKRLVAYVVAAAEREARSTEIKEHLSRLLPRYMLPAQIVVVERLPLNANGKLDRKALPDPELGADQSRASYAPPRTPLEEAIAEIWCEVLALERVGRRDDFFELGGHSLLGVQVVSRLRRRTGRDIPLRALFDQSELSGFAARVEETTEHARRVEAIEPASRDGAVPLSYAQQRLWFLWCLEPESSAYHLTLALRMRGDLDRALLERCFEALIARHESLRTRFAPSGDGAVQIIDPPRLLGLELEDSSALEPALREPAAQALVESEASRPFDLERGPLLRVKLATLGQVNGSHEHLLLVTMHHIISDEESMRVLVEEFLALYEAGRERRKPSLAPLAVQYADFAIWQRRWLAQGELERQLGYWKAQLGSEHPVLELPADRPRPSAMSAAGASVSFELDPALCARLRERARAQGVTPFMLLLAAFQLLLFRYSGQRQIRVGVPNANRNHLEIERCVGFFVNTQVLAAELSPELGFDALLAAVKRAALEAQAHQDVPFEQLVDALNPQRSLSHTPLFQVMFNHLVAERQALRSLRGLSLEPFGTQGQSSQFDLTLDVAESADGHFACAFSYATDLFDAWRIEQLGRHFVCILEQAIERPERALGAFELVSAANGERRELLGYGRGPERRVPVERGYAALLLERARSTPERLVARGGGGSLTYAELESRSAYVAAGLQARGVPLEGRVGVLVERGVELLGFAIGVLRAGAIYVPLDPSHPPERLARALTRARLQVVLCSPASAQKLAAAVEALGGATEVELWAPPATPAGEPLPFGAARYAGPRSVAYVIHTSGSTGEPKGAMVEHAGMLNNVLGKVSDLGLTEADVIAQTASAAFDISVWQLLTGPLCGARVEIVPDAIAQDPEALLRHVQATGITVLESVPSLIEALLSEPAEPLPSLRWMITTGEAMSPDLARRWRERYPEVGLLNAYGPAECADDVALCRIEASSEGRLYLPIGRATDNNRLYVLDAALGLVPFGATGELCIAGVGPGRGYLDAPGHTARAFVPNPYAEEPGERLYRTGDRVRFEPDGSLAFVGRADDQVKIRGYRLELGEIEARLREHAAVQEGVVVVKGGAQGKRLVAYVVAAAEREARSTEIKEHLSRLLPRYMLPAQIVVVERLPLSANGKLDRKALPDPDPGADGAPQAYEPPSTLLERILAEIWGAVLALERVGRHDDFFELGGHSLLGVHMLSRVRRRTGRDVPLRALFEQSELEQFAVRVLEAPELDRGLEPALVPVARDAALPLSFAQQRLWFLWRIEPESAAYNIPLALRVRGELDRGLLGRSFTALLARHEGLRTRFVPSGDGIVQLIDPPGELDIGHEDLRALGATERERAARALVESEASRPFDLERGPLLRIKLVALGAADGKDEHLVLVTMHHIISDEESMRVLVDEFLSLYAAGCEGRAAPLPPLPVQYADYAVWQRNWLVQGEVERQLGYWQARLGSEHPPLELPTDRPRPSLVSPAGARVSFELDAGLCARLRGFARARRVTPFMVYLASFQLLLFRHSGQRQIRVGVPNANRNRVEIERCVGFFVNTQVLAGELAPALGFDALLAEVKDAALGAQAYQDLPFEQLVDALNPQRSLSHNPLFQVMFNHQAAERRSLRSLPGLSLELFEAETLNSQFDLTLDVVEGQDGSVSCAFSYATDLFDAWRIQQLGRHFVRILEQALEQPERTLGAFELVARAELDRLLEHGRGPERSMPHERGYVALLLGRARRTPERLVARCAGASLTSAQLDARSALVAAGLSARGVPLEGRVGVLVERGLDLLGFAVGVLRAGAVYVPLDPSHPPERLARSLLRARIRVVLCSPATAALLTPALQAAGGADDVQLWVPRAEASRHAAAVDDARDDSTYAGPRSVAYVIHTSGSTGEPKGAMVEHAGMLNNVLGKVSDLGLTEADVIAQTASAAFDISVWQLLTGPLCGARVEIVPDAIAQDPEALLRHVQATGITVLESVPSLIEALLSEPAEPLPSLRWMITTGEAMSPDLARRWRERYPEVGLLNAYGPAECADDVALCRIEPLSEARSYLSIGRATDNNRLYVLDANLEFVPFGLTGELCIAGVGPGRGYLDAPGHTARVFVPNPYAEEPGERLYRTGDRVRFESDGSLAFVGRADHQVKIRGYRLELGEIEARLREHPAVQEGVVVAKDGAQGKRLVAYVVAPPDVTADSAEITEHLSRLLPRYMLPAQIVVLERLPLNANGKLDRKALPDPEVGANGARQAYVPPITPLEQTLAEIWGEVLALERVGRHDDFFELGGHSLLGAQMLSRVRRRTGRDVPLRALFEQSELAQLAVRVLEAPDAAGGVAPLAADAALALSLAQPGAEQPDDGQRKADTVHDEHDE